MKHTRSSVIVARDQSVDEYIATYPSSTKPFDQDGGPHTTLGWVPCRPLRNDDDPTQDVITSGARKWLIYDWPDPRNQPQHDPIAGLDVCAVCENIEIAQLLSNGPSKRHYLGSFEDVRKCQGCDLCRLIACGLEDDLDIFRAVTQNSDELRLGFIVLECVPTIAPLPRARRNRPYELMATLLHIATRQILRTVRIRLLGQSAKLIGKASPFHARVVDQETANLALAREWLNECCLTHDCSQNSYTNSPDLDRIMVNIETKSPAPQINEFAEQTISLVSEPNRGGLRVIDVEQGHLCTVPWSAKYAALSYVWPRFNTLRLTRQTTEGLHRPGVIFLMQDELPRVIRDAIDVVRRLEIRFLWVDALCITQDDDIEKATLIRAMDRVYGNSLVTLVVASSTPSEEDYGIPGINGTPRAFLQHSAELEGLQLATGLSSLDSALETSVWSTRGWTFQEILLSKRCLVFSDNQLYFRCPRDYRSEEIEAEQEEPRISHPAMPHTLRGRRWQLEYLMGRTFLDSVSKRDTFHHYAQLVSGYTPRKFTEPEDILNGFYGIMMALSSQYSSHISESRGFFVGHPIHLFDRAMLWYPAAELERRRDKGGTTLPTWCWAGWEGSVAYEKDKVQLGDSDSQRAMLIWWRKVGETLIPLRHSINGIPSDMELSHGMLISRSREMTPTQLIFWGQCIKLSVSQDESCITHWLDDNQQTLPCFTILDAEGHPCGLLPSADRNWAERHAQNEQREYEFLALSVAEQSTFDSIDQRSQWFHSKYKIPTASEKGKLVYFTNVMLLEYDDRGIAYRCGIGRVHNYIKHWEDADRKIIILG